MEKAIAQFTQQIECETTDPRDVAETLKEVEAKLKVSFPDDYINFITVCNGGEGIVGNSYLAMWDVKELVSLNEDYGVAEFAPWIVLFGGNGGGLGYGFDKRSHPMRIVEVDYVCIDDPACQIECGQSFLQFLEFLFERS